MSEKKINVEQLFTKSAEYFSDLKNASSKMTEKLYQGSIKVKNYFENSSSGAITAFLSMPELLKWSESLTKSAATAYDKALDAEYLKTHIGGGNHRLFDGGHSLWGAWEKAKEALPDDQLAQEVIGYVSALWKDLTTIKGLPFTTIDKDSFEKWSEKLSDLPGIEKSYLADLLSFDAFEVLSPVLGTVSIIFGFNKKDQEKISEILGAMGITSIIAGNPLMGITVISLCAYSYFVKKQKLNNGRMIQGTAAASTSLLICSILGLPFLIELVIVVVVSILLKKHVLNNTMIIDLIRKNLTQLQESGIQIAKRISIMKPS